MKKVIFAAVAAMFACAPVVNADDTAMTTTATMMSDADCAKEMSNCNTQKDPEACKKALMEKGCKDNSQTTQ